MNEQEKKVRAAAFAEVLAEIEQELGGYIMWQPDNAEEKAAKWEAESLLNGLKTRIQAQAKAAPQDVGVDTGYLMSEVNRIADEMLDTTHGLTSQQKDGYAEYLKVLYRQYVSPIGDTNNEYSVPQIFFDWIDDENISFVNIKDQHIPMHIVEEMYEEMLVDEGIHVANQPQDEQDEEAR